MPSETLAAGERSYRLHPLSLLFSLGSLARRMLIPGLIVLLAASRSEHYEIWLMALFVPSAGFALVKYVSFRYRFGEGEIVINQGILQRRERYIPYARIQNIDTLQDVAHRLFGVATVVVETASGTEPEATMSVLSLRAVEHMRAQVFAAKHAVSESAPAGLPLAKTAPVRQPAAATASGEPPVAEPVPAVAVPRPTARTVARIGMGDLIRLGLISNRGMVVVAGIWAVMWQMDLFERVELDDYVKDYAGEYVAAHPALAAGSWSTTLLWVVGGLLAFLLVLRLFSVGWAIVTLYGFRLTRNGDELRTRFGLLTRRSATIPRHRVQLLHVEESLLHRWLGRISVKVETAGARGARSVAVGREWLLPLIRKTELAGLLSEVQPELDITGVRWRCVDPRARGRVLRRSMVLVLLLCGLLAMTAGPRGWLALVPLLPAVLLYAHRHVKCLGYALTPEAVLFRSGWLTRRLSAVRYGKIQTVTLQESPFDRRWDMACVHVDTANAGRVGHRIHVPYLHMPVAQEIFARLSREAAGTEFRW